MMRALSPQVRLASIPCSATPLTPPLTIRLRRLAPPPPFLAPPSCLFSPSSFSPRISTTPSELDLFQLLLRALRTTLLRAARSSSTRRPSRVEHVGGVPPQHFATCVPLQHIAPCPFNALPLMHPLNASPIAPPQCVASMCCPSRVASMCCPSCATSTHHPIAAPHQPLLRLREFPLATPLLQQDTWSPSRWEMRRATPQPPGAPTFFLPFSFADLLAPLLVTRRPLSHAAPSSRIITSSPHTSPCHIT